MASFRGGLTEELLDRAESASSRPFDRERLLRRAAELDIPIARPSADSDARTLLSRLRSGAAIDPVLAGALLERLSERSTGPVPDELSDVVEWIGASDRARGLALRDVLRLYDTIARSRTPVPEAAAPRFPRFAVRPERRAS